MNTFKIQLKNYSEACRDVSVFARELTHLKSNPKSSNIRIRKAHTRLKLARSARRRAKMRVEELILRVPDELRMREILRMRYIEFMLWKDISDCIGLELRWIMRLHKRALDLLDKELTVSSQPSGSAVNIE